jgi:hypothetical protein
MALEPFRKSLPKQFRLAHAVCRGGDLEVFFELRGNAEIERDHPRKLGLLYVVAGFAPRRRFAFCGSLRSGNGGRHISSPLF